jgi:hypothetical protein
MAIQTGSQSSLVAQHVLLEPSNKSKYLHGLQLRLIVNTILYPLDTSVNNVKSIYKFRYGWSTGLVDF